MQTATWPEVGIANDLISLVARVSAGVVSIGGRRDVRESALATLGAGLVWSRPEIGGTLIVSNAHVVDALGDAAVTVVSAGDTTFSAKRCAVDRARDLALLHVADVSELLVPLANTRAREISSAGDLRQAWRAYANGGGVRGHSARTDFVVARRWWRGSIGNADVPRRRRAERLQR